MGLFTICNVNCIKFSTFKLEIQLPRRAFKNVEVVFAVAILLSKQRCHKLTFLFSKQTEGLDNRTVSISESVASTLTAHSEEEMSSGDDDNGEDNGETSDTESAPSPPPQPGGLPCGLPGEKRECEWIALAIIRCSCSCRFKVLSKLSESPVNAKKNLKRI